MGAEKLVIIEKHLSQSNRKKFLFSESRKSSLFYTKVENFLQTQIYIQLVSQMQNKSLWKMVKFLKTGMIRDNFVKMRNLGPRKLQAFSKTKFANSRKKI